MLEVEVKIKTDLDAIERKLIEMGFVRGTTAYEYDTYYNGKLVDLKTADKALRIRLHKDVDTGRVKYVLNFKGPKLDDTTMTREETQFEVPSMEAGETVINGLGYFAAGNVEKTRIHYKSGDITCCLDSVTGLGDFLEIEIMAGEADYDGAVAKIEKLLDELGVSMADTVRESYLCMLGI